MTEYIMRTIIEIPDQQLELMKPLLELEGISRAELIRRAVKDYLLRFEASDDETAFGLWSKSPREGLHYQEELRSEWD